MTRALVMNAFRPAAELDEPELFAGRDHQVRLLTDTLYVQGSVPLIYGDRGIGKSSLAVQMQLIAMGHTELLTHLFLQHLILPPEQQYTTFKVSCTDAMSSVADLLQVLINAAESVEFLSAGDGRATQLTDRTTRKKVSLKFVELESTKQYQTEKGRLSYQDLGLEEKLVQLVDVLVQATGQPVLFIIDELDRLKKTAGLSSFLKAASSVNLKFMLVGIADSVSQLLTDHVSLGRALTPTNLPTMTASELRTIVVRAEQYLAEHGINVHFNDDAKRRLARVAQGYPWFVHVLGQSALMDVYDRGEYIVQEVDVARAVVNVIHNRVAQQYSDRYATAVKDSYPRELVLRTLAKWEGTDIPLSDLYVLLNGIGVQNPSVYRGHLASADYGAVLFHPVFQKKGLIRFADEMFKAYVRLRPSIYDGADRAVDEAWERRYGS